MSWFTQTFGGGEQRDNANEALDRSQTQIMQGTQQVNNIQRDMLAAVLKQNGLTDAAVNAIINQAMSYMQNQGQGMIEQRRREAEQQTQGQMGVNRQMQDFFMNLQNMQNQQNAPQLQAQTQALAAIMPKVLGVAGGVQGFEPTAMTNIQLGEFNKMMNNQMASRGLGNSSAALTNLREGQQKLLAADQQTQYNNLMDMFKNLTGRAWSQVSPQSINLTNPYADLPKVSEAMQLQGQNMVPLFQAAANQAGATGLNAMQAQANYGNNLSNAAQANANSLAGIQQQYATVPQGGFMTALNNIAGLYSTLGGNINGASWSNPMGFSNQRKGNDNPTLSAAGAGRPAPTSFGNQNPYNQPQLRFRYEG